MASAEKGRSGEHAADGYLEKRKKRWKFWATLGIGTAALAAIGFLALQPWLSFLAPSTIAYINASLASGAIVGGGVGLGSLLGHSTEKKSKH